MIRRLVVVAAIAVFAVAIGVAMARKPAVAAVYEREQVAQAFAEQGFELRVAPGLGPETLYENGRSIMAPSNGEFAVYVAANASEARAWSTRHVSA